MKVFDPIIFDQARPTVPFDWDKIFAKAHLRSWPSDSISISNSKPPDHGVAIPGRNVFKDDEMEIMAAAEKHGYGIISPAKSKVVSFLRRTA